MPRAPIPNLAETPIWPLWNVTGLTASSGQAGVAEATIAATMSRSHRTIAATVSRRYGPGMLTRRQLLGGAVLGLLASRFRLARAIGPGSKFRFGQLQLGSTWNA